MKSFLPLREYLSKHKWHYIFGVTCLLIIDLVQLIIPQIFRALTDDLQNHTLNKGGITRYALFIILTGVIIGVGRYFWRIYIIGSSRSIEYYLRQKLFDHLLSLSPNYFNSHKTGDLMAHATNDINAVRMALGPGTIMIVDSGFMIVFSLFMMVKTTSLRLTAMSVFTLPLLIFLVTRFGKMIYKRFKNVQESFSNLTDVTQESFSGIRVIKAFVQEGLVSNNFTKINQDNLDKNLDLVKIHGVFNPILQFVASISFLVVILYGGREVIQNKISLGDFIAFNSYLGLLIWPTRALGMVINVLQRGAASMDRLNTIFDEKSEIVEIENPVELSQVKGNVIFDNVSFKYPNSNHYALKDISFTLREDKMLAIVGRTGSGKSTIANLILRLYDIDKGNIYLDNINIKDLSISTIRESIGFVPQDNFLFSRSIKDNIAFAFDDEISLDRVIEASKKLKCIIILLIFQNNMRQFWEKGVSHFQGDKNSVPLLHEP